MEQGQPDNEQSEGPKVAFTALIFSDGSDEVIKRFSGLNVPAPEEGEEIYLKDVELEANDDGGEITSSNLYLITSVEKSYVDFVMEDEEEEEEFDPDSPYIHYDITVQEVEQETEDPEK